VLSIVAEPIARNLTLGHVADHHSLLVGTCRLRSLNQLRITFNSVGGDFGSLASIMMKSRPSGATSYSMPATLKISVGRNR
jgi:hypothetical protein